MSAPTRRVIAGFLAVIGLVWLGQGIGLIPGSFMSGQAFWALMGVVFLAVAFWLVRSRPAE